MANTQGRKMYSIDSNYLDKLPKLADAVGVLSVNIAIIQNF